MILNYIPQVLVIMCMVNRNMLLILNQILILVIIMINSVFR